MFRKTVLALTAVAALGTVAFTATEASAHGYGYYGKRHYYGYRHYAPSYGYCFYKKVWNDYTYSWNFIKVCR
jgi:hypothetical protein